MQSSRVNDSLTRNSVDDRFRSMTLQRCGGLETLFRQKEEFVCANPVTVLGRKRTRMMTCIDSLSLSFSTQEK